MSVGKDDSLCFSVYGQPSKLFFCFLLTISLDNSSHKSTIYGSFTPRRLNDRLRERLAADKPRTETLPPCSFVLTVGKQLQLFFLFVDEGFEFVDLCFKMSIAPMRALTSSAAPPRTDRTSAEEDSRANARSSKTRVCPDSGKLVACCSLAPKRCITGLGSILFVYFSVFQC